MSDEYSTFAAKYNYQDSERFKKILKILMSVDQAKLANMLPATYDDLAKKSGKSAEEVKSLLDDLFTKGVVFESSQGYRPARSVFQLHDSTGSDRRSDELWGRDLLDAWMDFCDQEMFPDVSKLAANMPKPFIRVIPAMKSVAEPDKVTPNEDIIKFIENSTKIAVVKCPCRRMAQRCERPIEVCLQLNRGAEYAIKRGSGTEISKEEALKIAKTASEAGLIHTVTNIPEAGHFVCNCCPDCCVLIYPWLTYGNLDKGMAKSRFEAKVDVESCSGCQDCVEQCPFGAIEMVKVTGQKKMKAHVNAEKCYGCGCCAVNCTTDSIKLYEVRPLEYVTS